MADDIVSKMQSQREALLVEGAEVELLSPLDMMEILSLRHADFHLYVISPSFERNLVPEIVMPEKLSDSDDFEFVYPILDYGDQLSTSKGDDAINSLFSMCKLYFTIEKMINILIERLKASGVGELDEVQVALGGHELSQRKGFESIINLKYNVVVTNFDPAEWGEAYLRNVKQLSKQGFGYPPEAPRDSYKHPTIEIKVK